jgi:hypothetical protein
MSDKENLSSEAIQELAWIFPRISAAAYPTTSGECGIRAVLVEELNKIRPPRRSNRRRYPHTSGHVCLSFLAWLVSPLYIYDETNALLSQGSAGPDRRETKRYELTPIFRRNKTRITANPPTQVNHYVIQAQPQLISAG